ncbi:unnamed protein product [Coccothraustes coccothraustes]
MKRRKVIQQEVNKRFPAHPIDLADGRYTNKGTPTREENLWFPRACFLPTRLRVFRLRLLPPFPSAAQREHEWQADTSLHASCALGREERVELLLRREPKERAEPETRTC